MKKAAKEPQAQKEFDLFKRRICGGYTVQNYKEFDLFLYGF
jgi:hypothetical protein